MLHPTHRHLEAIVRDSEGRQVARCLIRRGHYGLGQEKTNEIVIDEASVSAAHARLTVVNDEEFFIEDEGSANGTFVDGHPASSLTPVKLESRLQIGRCTLEFQRGGLPAAVYRYLPDGFLRSRRYDLGNVLTEGRSSTIYEAHDTTLNREIAIKIMRPECQVLAANVLQFIRDAQITSQLQHTGILSPYEFGLNDQRQLYYTTRLVEGESLGSVLSEIAAGDADHERKHSLTSLMAAFQKVCDIVAYAHSRGVVHGALTSDCITLGVYGEVMVVDWCGAQILENGESAYGVGPRPVLAPPSIVMPAPGAFTPPELIDADVDQISRAADVYALGAILYHILTLRPPVRTGDEEDLKLQILHSLIPSPLNLIRASLMHWHVGTIPEVLSGIALKALQLDPESRYSSVIALQEAVTAWQTNPARSARAGSRVRIQSDFHEVNAPCGVF